PFDWIRSAIDKLKVDGIWQARARSSLRDRIVGAQRELAGQVFSVSGCGSAESGIDALRKVRPGRFERTEELLEQMRESESTDFASLTVAVNEIATLVGDNAD
ncbi:MAG: hypothetical protein AAFQ16_04765, partial [Pseudomonadota bacterium]